MLIAQSIGSCTVVSLYPRHLSSASILPWETVEAWKSRIGSLFQCYQTRMLWQCFTYLNIITCSTTRFGAAWRNVCTSVVCTVLMSWSGTLLALLTADHHWFSSWSGTLLALLTADHHWFSCHWIEELTESLCACTGTAFWTLIMTVWCKLMCCDFCLWDTVLGIPIPDRFSQSRDSGLGNF